MNVSLEPLDDGSVIVRGMPLDELRARVLPRPPGRPPGPTITRAELLAVVASRRRWGFHDDPTQDELALDLAVSRTRLREAIGRNFGGWRQFLSFSATSEPGNSDQQAR